MSTEKMQIALFLQGQYNEAGRYYHNINHVKFLLAKADEWLEDAMIPYQNLKENQYREFDLILRAHKCLNRAIWWHDAWYSVWDTPGNNEFTSADLFETWEAPLIEKRDRDAIRTAILRTENHTEDQHFNGDFELEHLVSKLMLDVDMAGFGLNFSAVIKNTYDVFKEYEVKGESSEAKLKVYSGNVAFLNKLLARKRIYYTDYFFNKYEKIARENIERVIKHLTPKITRLHLGLPI